MRLAINSGCVSLSEPAFKLSGFFFVEFAAAFHEFQQQRDLLLCVLSIERFAELGVFRVEAAGVLLGLVGRLDVDTAAVVGVANSPGVSCLLEPVDRGGDGTA